MTTLAALRDGWDHAARQDAMGNIISIPGLTHDEFMEMGRQEIAQVLDDVASQGIEHGDRLALDFGCGIGRLSVALAEHFESVSAVDFSLEMIVRAIPHERVRYFQRDSLKDARDGRYDFVYSNITLQHMPPELQEGYVRSFVRLLAPDGVAVFAITDCPDFLNGHLSMYGTPSDTVEAWVTDAGGRVRHVEPGMQAAYTSCTYTVTL